MPITIAPNKFHVKKTDGSGYLPCNVVTGETTEEQCTRVTNQGTSEVNRVVAKGNEVLADLSGSTEMEGMIAGTFAAANTYSAGTYVIYPTTVGSSTVNKLYRLTADHAANVTWENASKVEVKLGNDVSDLKSALSRSALSDFTGFTFTVFGQNSNRIQSKILYFPFETILSLGSDWDIAYDKYTPDASSKKLTVSSYTNFLTFPLKLDAGWYVLKARKHDDSAISSSDITYFKENARYSDPLQNAPMYQLMFDETKYFTFSSGTILQTLDVTIENDCRIDYGSLLFAFDRYDSLGNVDAWIDFTNEIHYLSKGKYALKFKKTDSSEIANTDIETLAKEIKVSYDTDDNVLRYKKITVIGDSYVANHSDPISYTWHYRMAERNYMPYTNLGINGGPLVYDGVPEKAPVVDRLNTIPAGTDYIVIIGGENDRNYQLPIADFKAGINEIIDYLNLNFPKAKVCFFTPWRQDYTQFTISIDEYIDAIVEVCSERSVPCYNSGARSGFHMEEQAFRNAYCQSAADESHLNYAGHTRFLNQGEQFILGI